MSSLRVLSVASEMFPLIKTGGLADVTGALPAALESHGVQTCTLLPGYPAVLRALTDTQRMAVWPDFFGGGARLLQARFEGRDLLVLDAPHLYAREGNPYLGPDGHDWPDNAERFAALSFAAARVAWGQAGVEPPQVIHAHDWQAALTPAYLHYLGEGLPRPRQVLTVHNLAFQGRFDRKVFGRLGLPMGAFTSEGLEYHGDVGFLKTGLLLADAITAVSPGYADEVRTSQGGMGLDGILRWRAEAVTGIVNGIDTEVWNPRTDAHLAARYDEDHLDARRHNRRAVEQHFGLLPEDEGLLLCMISRMADQKGTDLVLDALDALLKGGTRLVVLGSGDRELEARWRSAADHYRGRLGVQVGYDERVSHLMQGGCDAIVIPSRFEPCGLTQLCGLRYGCVPIVAHVGGLADTVIDANDAALRAGVATGLHLRSVNHEGLVNGVNKATQLHADRPTWQRLQRAGMLSDVGWEASAARYAALYRRGVGQ
ncbi:glycogen synthase GlgA [Ideonella sp. DXS29W]|uniref:Glycogen synthase n=1 Tax=Ideonella lacteola TaxID=2984193 RepID=A0ABU9BVV6_9BURK